MRGEAKSLENFAIHTIVHTVTVHGGMVRADCGRLVSTQSYYLENILNAEPMIQRVTFEVERFIYLVNLGWLFS
jgi:hypothetical protein